MNTPLIKHHHRRHSAAGFSLAECMISIGIASSALLGVVGLLAGTLTGMRETRMESASGLIMRQLLAEARDLAQTRVEQTGGAGNQNLEIVVVYDEAMRILEHSVQNPAALSTHTTGSSDQRAFWMGRVIRDPLPLAVDPLMDRLVITVEAPAGQPPESRKVRQYASLVPKS
jgi:type II secretory pathway pseudopilin PulG